MLRHLIVAGSGLVSVLVVSFLMARTPEPEPAEASDTADHVLAVTRKMKPADLVVPVFAGGSVTGYIVANVTGELTPEIGDEVAGWYLSDALLQLLHDEADVPTVEEKVPESQWLRARLEEAANRRHGSPMIKDLDVTRIKYLKRI
ncbi:MAG: hypothetical protein R3D65_09060 [Zhengella sp.]|uniref:hypothetical protein n=1 Tax=Zhengella sp. TaxID=2282762 RepID=UPI001D5AAD2A|nr:hypothetical protein [Notoacmeibacter sp.]MCC0025494.1 hypothetical protein [Brucellaceae bacterium]